MEVKKIIYGYMALLAVTTNFSCNKDWLNAKPDRSLVIPSGIADYQALLDNTNGEWNLNQASLAMVGDGDFQVTDTRYSALTAQERSAYIWAPTSDNFYGGFPASDWQNAYSRILNANVVLDGIRAIKPDAGYDNVKGTALFYRSYDLYNLSQEFCLPYDPATAQTDLGLPLRLSADINLQVGRSSVEQTYNQIITDLLAAAKMLPAKAAFLTRPSKAAVFSVLSRVYLSRQDYAKAFLYADSSLQLQSSLMDFNQLAAASAHPIARFNAEVIFSSTLTGYVSYLTTRLVVDPVLYQSYAANDLRKSVYFLTVSGSISYKGSYDGGGNFFGGPATDEMYLNRAEGYARNNDATNALKDLNTLLKTRWKTGTYVNMTAPSADAALALVLAERRKELVYRNLRWTDLRRLNKDPRFQTTLTRTVLGQAYTLLPNSLRYVLPIDFTEIQLGGLTQNPR